MGRFKENDLMATLASFVESTAFGVINNFLSEFHSDNGYALPSRYEVIITSPAAGDARKEPPACFTENVCFALSPAISVLGVVSTAEYPKFFE